MIVAQETPPPAVPERRPALRLVLCHNCRRPLCRAHLVVGSVVEFKCKSCGGLHLELGRAG